MRCPSSILFSLILFWTAPGFGASEQPLTLDAILVTAERISSDHRTGDVDGDGHASFSSVIRRDVFEGKTESLAEVIEKESGVQVRKSGGIGSFSSVSLRGASSDQVMVFLDGIALNDASGGGVDLSQIALADVAAIEIYRGVTPIHFGRASLGGVVNIRTRRAQKGFNATASGGYGSFNTRSAGGLLNHKPGRWDYLVSVDYLSSDNDFKFLNDGGTQWNPSDDRVEKRLNAQMAQHNLLGKIGYDITSAVRVDLTNQYFEKDQALPGWNNSPHTRTRLQTARNITTLQLIADDLTPLGLNTRSQISYTWKDETYDDRGGHIGLGRQHDTYTTRRFGADFFGEWRTGRHAWIFSAGAANEAYETMDRLTHQLMNDNRRSTLSLGIQDSLSLLGNRLVLIPAVRYTWIRDERKSDAVVGGRPAGETARHDSYPSPQIGAKLRLFPWLTLRSNLARYVREPSFFELFGDRGVIIGNSELRKEKGVNFDVGAVCDWQPPYPWLQRITLTAAYFKNDADDLITRVYDARGIGKSVNISGARIQGVEAGAVVELFGHLRAIANATWQDPVNRSEIGAFNGKKLPGRFEHAYLGRLEVRLGGFTVHAEYVREAQMYYDTANLLKAEDKEEFNAGIAWLWRSMKIAVTGKNLGDARHEDINGYPLPGRSFHASVKYDFH